MGEEPRSSSEQAPARRSRHLLDPNDLRGSHQRTIGNPTSLRNVQRWVLSVLAVSTIVHFAGALVVAAAFMEPERFAARMVLIGLAGLVGMGAVATGMAIHGKRPASPWLLLGLLPALVGGWLTLR